jgi:hypothetical protein
MNMAATSYPIGQTEKFDNQHNVRFGSKADKPSRAKTHRCLLLSESGHNFSHLASKASWSSSVTEEYDHARRC